MKERVSIRRVGITALIISLLFAVRINVNAADYSGWISIFDPAYYQANCQEAAAYANGNIDRLWDYFVNIGIPRGDQASAEFNVFIYADNYPSLKSQFGGDMIQYYLHYAGQGKKLGLNAVTPIDASKVKAALPTDYPGIIYAGGKPVIGVNAVIRVMNPSYGVWTSGSKKVEIQSELSQSIIGQIYASNDCNDAMAAIYGNAGAYRYVDSVNTPFGIAKIYKKITAYERDSYFNGHYEAFIKTDRGYVGIIYTDSVANRIPTSTGNVTNFASRKNAMFSQVSSVELQNFKSIITVMFSK